MKELVQILKEKGMTIGSCESLTAGLFTSRMAEVPGASAVLKGGIVTYQTPIKEMVAHVSHEIIQEYGVISAECAEAMAVSVRRLLDADLCVSFTGNAGPECMEDKPAGTVYCALADRKGCATWHFHFAHAERNEVRALAVDEMVLRVKRYLNEGQGTGNGREDSQKR